MQAPIFEKIYADYLADVAVLDFSQKAEMLGLKVNGKTIGIPFFERPFTVTPDGISDPHGKRPHHAVSVILCKYLLLSPDNGDGDRELVTFKDFKDAAPIVEGFRNTAERPIASHFTGRMAALESRCRQLGGNAADIGVSTDLAYVFSALPRVPVYLLFNDKDDEFPAECTLLFQKSAGDYLDMECLAMIGMVLAKSLTSTDKPIC